MDIDCLKLHIKQSFSILLDNGLSSNRGIDVSCNTRFRKIEICGVSDEKRGCWMQKIDDAGYFRGRKRGSGSTVWTRRSDGEKSHDEEGCQTREKEYCSEHIVLHGYHGEHCRDLEEHQKEWEIFLEEA